MKIILNGTVWVNDEELYFDELEIEVDKEIDNLDIPFLDDEDFDDECEYCDGDCEYCELDEESDSLDELIEGYTEILQEECLCEDCLKAILIEFLHDFISLAEEQL